MVVGDVEEGVVAQAVVDVVLTLASALADLVDARLRFFVESTVVEGVFVDGDTQLEGKFEEMVLLLGSVANDSTCSGC